MEGTRYRRLRRTCVAIRAESATAGRRPSFRGMSATDSENAQNSGRIPVGISGRVPSEWVADLRRNQWPRWVGIRRRLRPRRFIDHGARSRRGRTIRGASACGQHVQATRRRSEHKTGHFYFGRKRTFLNWVDTDFELTWFMDRLALQCQKCKSGRSYGHKIESIILHDME